MTEITGPTKKQFKELIRNKDTVEVCCQDGTRFIGIFKWVDLHATCLETKQDGVVTINLDAINWYKKIV